MSHCQTQIALRRIGAVAALLGPLVLLAATLMHPMRQDPADLPAAFAEYGADAHYVWTHLGQLAGFALIGAALVCLAAQLEQGPAAAWGRLGVFAAAVAIAISAALQAVDGMALKALVDRWAHAQGAAKAAVFEAAFAVRQIEIGLAAALSLSFGASMLAFACGLMRSRRFPLGFAGLGALAGAGTLAAGAAQAATGFSDLAMTLSMSASVAALVWGALMSALLRRARY